MAHERTYDPTDSRYQQLREICLQFPEATEIETWGRPTFRVGKIFCLFGKNKSGDEGVIFKTDPEEDLVFTQDTRFERPPYFPKWHFLHLDDGVDWGEVRELVDTSYRTVATKKQITALDAQQ